jgi:hypothetical protein
MDTNRVLSEIMGTDERPHDIKARLEALFALIGDGDLAGARQAAEALRADIGVDPEIVKADAVIRDPRHCGAAKGDWYDAKLFISPLDPGCGGRFIYDVDGKVRGVDPADEGAKETIAHLDLDGARLRALRNKAIEALVDGLDHDLEPEERRVL